MEDLNIINEATPNTNATTKNLTDIYKKLGTNDKDVRPGYDSGDEIKNAGVVYQPAKNPEDVGHRGLGGIRSAEHKLTTQTAPLSETGGSLIDFYNSVFRRLDIEKNMDSDGKEIDLSDPNPKDKTKGQLSKAVSGIALAKKLYSDGNFASRNVHCLIDGQLANFYCWGPSNKHSGYDFIARAKNGTGDPKYWTKSDGTVVEDSTKLGKENLYSNSDEVWLVDLKELDRYAKIGKTGQSFDDRSLNAESGKNSKSEYWLSVIKKTTDPNIILSNLDYQNIGIIGTSVPEIEFYVAPDFGISDDDTKFNGFIDNSTVKAVLDKSSIVPKKHKFYGETVEFIGGSKDFWVNLYIAILTSSGSLERQYPYISRLVEAIAIIYLGGANVVLNNKVLSKNSRNIDKHIAAGEAESKYMQNLASYGSIQASRDKASRRTADLRNGNVIINSDEWHNIYDRIKTLLSSIVKSRSEIQEQIDSLNKKLSSLKDTEEKNIIKEKKAELTRTLDSLAGETYVLSYLEEKFAKSIDKETGEIIDQSSYDEYTIEERDYNKLLDTVRSLKLDLADVHGIKVRSIAEVEKNIAILEAGLASINPKKQIKDLLQPDFDRVGLSKRPNIPGKIGRDNESLNTKTESLEGDTMKVLKIEEPDIISQPAVNIGQDMPYSDDINEGSTLVSFIQNCWSQIQLLEQPEFENLGALVNDLKDSLYVAVGQAEQLIGSGNGNGNLGVNVSTNYPTKLDKDAVTLKTDTSNNQVLNEIDCDFNEALEGKPEFQKDMESEPEIKSAIKDEAGLQTKKVDNLINKVTAEDTESPYEEEQYKAKPIDESKLWTSKDLKIVEDFDDSYVNSIDFN